ncbi:hypothetical protein [Humibacillus xanthopallidus]|uniref:hypothetical protein n=1 Tax=Humibacillus xanthopallidus TaxID=412689 RepID=UPI0011511E3B|nr:hypothetical protein [Humibacillus xanthopallidus]
MTAEPSDAWLRAYAARLSRGVRDGSPVRRVHTPSGALVVHVGDVVVKVHHLRTDAAALSRRLAASGQLAARGLVVPPLSSRPVTDPASGRLVTAWPASTCWVRTTAICRGRRPANSSPACTARRWTR